MHYLRGLQELMSVLAVLTSILYERSCAVPDLWVLYEDYPSTFQWSQSQEEVHELCAPHLSHISSSFVINKWQLQQELSSSLGHWQQSSPGAPLIPFLPHQRPAPTKPTHLSSLHITELEMNYHRPICYVKAYLHLLITSWTARWKQDGPDFQIQPGFTSLKIALEGFYVKSMSGKRVLCMLGSAPLPVRGANASAPWEWLDSVKSNLGNAEFIPPSSPDSKMLAVFQFPDFPSLTTRAVIGKLSSLHTPSHPSYFSSINILAQLGASPNYEFVSDDLVASAACATSQQPPSAIEPPSKYLNGSHGSLCKLTQELLGNQWMTLMPDPNCNLSQDLCGKLGPFSFNISSSTLMGGGFDGIQLSVQDIWCEEIKEKDGSYSANVSAVFRALLPSENRSLVRRRSGIDGMTLDVEGKWSSSSSTFCMVGCRAGYPSTDSGKEEACDSMVYIMFVTDGLSLKQRSLLRGGISSIHSKSNRFPSLSFYQAVFPSLLPSVLFKKLAYSYTQITYAKALSEAYKRFRYGERIKNSMLIYPFANGELSDLYEYLTIPPVFVPLQSSVEPSAEHLARTTVKIQIVALEDLVGLDREQWASANVDGGRADEHEPYYRVAATLVVERIRAHLEQNDDVFAVSIEGVYDSTTGRMSMIGCRVVSATWAMLQGDAGLLEDGLDCHMLVRIEYPPMNGVQSLINPALKVSIMSDRAQDDPFFFPAIDLQTVPIMYTRQRGDFMSRRSIEGGLSVFILSLMLGCVAGQLAHMKRHADSTPYISTYMLAIQAVGLSLALITDMGALFASNVKGTRVIDFGVIQYAIKLLSLVASLLTLRIVHKVIESRGFLGSRPPKSSTVPSEKKVMVVCTAVYGIVLITMCINYIKTNQQYVDDYWEKVLQKFYGVVQDLFLLPQVVGNHLWQVKGKPLRMFFYVGVTFLRLLAHAYDGYVWPEGYIVPVVAVLLAILVYFQQRNHHHLRWNTVGLKSYRLHP